MRTISTLSYETGLKDMPKIPASRLGASLITRGQTWVTLIDPDDARRGIPWDAAAAEYLEPSVPLRRGRFPNLASSFDLGANYKITAAVDFPVEEFTMFFACRLSEAISGQIVRTIDDEDYPNDTTIRISYESSGASMRVYDGSDLNTLVAAFGPNNDWVDEVGYFMVTFSPAFGLRIYAQGALVSQNNSFVGWEDGWRAGQYEFLPGMRGDVGLIGILANDLSDPTRAAERAKIDSLMMSRYGIV